MSNYLFCFAGILSESLLNEMYSMTKCGDTDKKSVARHKRWARLGSTVWPADMMPLTISVANSPAGFTVQEIEDIALQCAEVRHYNHLACDTCSLKCSSLFQHNVMV